MPRPLQEVCHALRRLSDEMIPFIESMLVAGCDTHAICVALRLEHSDVEALARKVKARGNAFSSRSTMADVARGATHERDAQIAPAVNLGVAASVGSHIKRLATSARAPARGARSSRQVTA
jgi:hypothetical protein